MKRLIVLFCLMFLLTPTILLAEPFLTCDPQEGVTKYELTLGGVTSESDALPDGAAWHDIGSAPEGKTNASLKAGGPWTIDDEDQLIFVWSDPAPFVLGRPSVSQSPMNMSLKNSH